MARTLLSAAVAFSLVSWDDPGDLVQASSASPLLQFPRRRHARSRILPGQGIPADPQNFREHPQPIPKRVQPRPLAVCPQNRNLLHAQAGAARQKKNLRIESPAFDFLQRKDALRGLSPKSFESTLRVRETQPENHPQRQIEDSPKHLPVKWLTFGL